MNIQTTTQTALRNGLVLALVACSLNIAAPRPVQAQAPNSATAAAERKTAADKAAFYAGQRAKKAAELRQYQADQAGAAVNATKKAQFYAGQRAKAASKAAFWASYYKTHPYKGQAKPTVKK